MISFNIDYKNNKTELCQMSENYNYLSLYQFKKNINHNNSYSTILYNSLFENIKDKKLNIGIFTNNNCILTMLFNKYFKNSNIFTFHDSKEYINYFKIFTWNNTQIKLDTINYEYLKTNNLLYDIIINDFNKDFDNQILSIENTYHYLKDGGVFIVQNILNEFCENEYLERMSNILDKFQKYYFITINNNKLLILIKNGISLIEKNKKMTIITPSIRPSNLLKVRESINFDYVDEWIIVYDGNKINENPQLFKSDSFHYKINEYLYKDEGCSGNPQRNYALDNIKNENTFLYFLDDDNLIHPDLYKLFDIIDDNKFYTFDQKDRINGDYIEIYHIDTAMLLIDYNICKNIKWKFDLYNADGHYIKECYAQNKDKWVYINNSLCTYNIL